MFEMKEDGQDSGRTHDVCPHATEWARDAFADNVTYLTIQAAHGAREDVADALAPLGVSPRQMAIMRLLSMREPLRQQELGTLLGIDRTSMVALIDGLEERGYVIREADPTDRRAHALRLTEAGKKANAAIRQAIDSAEEKLLRDLTPDERDSFKAILRKLIAHRGVDRPCDG
jgi:DNA-binding MarR family transcriptional regulator